ncbi:hypothetical protein GVN21_14600 [Caulobacter sp. SLTY]|uniref:phosphorylase family protein n=1 Tax=Caulobacter sp. SLTY TaxID=2683262 RepID=UPI0014129684|nr:hypothetical protein [Caulobacter sp. SLTY]NBB16590.1 hypothetical protein [Caulobacter sp. SLTY]
MKILVAEDSADKIRRIREVVEAAGEFGSIEVVFAQTVVDAKAQLRDTHFDLLILDVLLPNRAGDEPGHACTVALLEELATRNSLKKPRHILGLTAYDEAIRDAGAAFISRTWAVVRFSFESDEWRAQLISSIRYILGEAQQERDARYETDLCVLTALKTPELDAVLRIPWAWQAAEPLDDVTFVRRGSFSSQGQSFSVVAASASKMGMVSAALLAAKLVERERPRYLVMPGICAGVKGKCGYGDIIVGDPVWDWQSGKHFVEADVAGFAIAPDPLPVSGFIRSRIDQLRADSKFWLGVKDASQSKPETELKMRLGPMATGSSVLADEDVLERILVQNRNLTAVEMEAYGVLAAAVDGRFPRPTAFAMKSVCDYADPTKDDQWQGYAAYTSAQALKEFFERYMAEIRDLAGSR